LERSGGGIPDSEKAMIYQEPIVRMDFRQTVVLRQLQILAQILQRYDSVRGARDALKPIGSWLK
jgi:hypothetical protein